MSTVADLIIAAKYDLVDFGAREYDETLIVHYLNRVLRILGYALIGMNSDQTLTKSDVTLSTGDDESSVPTTYTVNIRNVYDSDGGIVTRVSPEKLYDLREHISNTGKPNNWAHMQEKIEFDVEADDDYTYTVYHDVLPTVVTAASDMPYSGRYDGYIREALVSMVKAKIKEKLDKSDAVYIHQFKTLLHQDIINRNRVPKYRLDF